MKTKDLLKEIPGFGGRYGITKKGNVWDHIGKKWLKTDFDDYLGNVRVYLKKTSRNGLVKRERFGVAKLMILTFQNKKVKPSEEIVFNDGNYMNVELKNLIVRERAFYGRRGTKISSRDETPADASWTGADDTYM